VLPSLRSPAQGPLRLSQARCGPLPQRHDCVHAVGEGDLRQRAASGGKRALYHALAAASGGKRWRRLAIGCLRDVSLGAMACRRFATTVLHKGSTVVKPTWESSRGFLPRVEQVLRVEEKLDLLVQFDCAGMPLPGELASFHPACSVLSRDRASYRNGVM
jgi:hypothetical protein